MTLYTFAKYAAGTFKSKIDLVGMCKSTVVVFLFVKNGNCDGLITQTTVRIEYCSFLSVDFAEHVSQNQATQKKLYVLPQLAHTV